MAAIIRGIVRGSLEWRHNSALDATVPAKVTTVHMTKFDLTRFYSTEQINAYVDQLNQERLEWLRKFENLNPTILKTAKL
jgi:hypothetical protein